MEKAICVHGHFYQPPRENPWLEEVEIQESAYPFHDWNDRIAAECYAPNTAARILDSDGKISAITNTYSRISFNFGPTLLSWMERHAPETYRAILEADRLGAERYGHGTAIAQVYNHMIMPLASRADKYTQALWGIRDFETRFGRKPEGLWLPETAVDTESLEVLAELGIAFTILAPHQAAAVRPAGGDEESWRDVSGGHVDPTLPYHCPLPSGRSIALFFYDGPVSHDLAFDGLLDNGDEFARRLEGIFPDEGDDGPARLGHIATDGETYGHHHYRGEMALAYCLNAIEEHSDHRLTVYGAFLEAHPPQQEVRIVENSSWSCIHGIERWRSDCGCNSGGHPGWTQRWRAPLRAAMDWLRDTLAPDYEKTAGDLLRDPWRARDDYIDVVLDRSPENVASFLEAHALKPLDAAGQRKCLKLLELQRHAMLIYTSCGWFFDEISGIETTQVLRYAARALHLAEETLGLHLEEEFARRLEEAPSNITQFGNGMEVYNRLVRVSRIDLHRVGAHYAVSSLFREQDDTPQTIYCYAAECLDCEKHEAGASKMALGRTRFVSHITRDEETITFAALHLGGHNVLSGLSSSIDDSTFEAFKTHMNRAFELGNISELVSTIDTHFGHHSYTLWHLFRDEQRRIMKGILGEVSEQPEHALHEVINTQYTLLNFLREIDMPFPRTLSVAAEIALNADIADTLEAEELDLERLDSLLDAVLRWEVPLDRDAQALRASHRIRTLMLRFADTPLDTALIGRMNAFLETIERISLNPNYWEAQNSCFSVAGQLYPEQQERADRGDSDAAAWLEAFRELSDHLQLRLE
ncbi:MAG: DUF3536 domain-containing protein [Synergistales bacterium]|nr:DUF3536 domain-containing protein [Synergistales bacterium]